MSGRDLIIKTSDDDGKKNQKKKKKTNAAEREKKKNRKRLSAHLYGQYGDWDGKTWMYVEQGLI
jgi:hypothetical protein